MTGKKWIRTFLILFVGTLIAIGAVVFFVDPFFHYRAPRDFFYYRLYDQRSQNDGITRNFEYDALLTGTSMAENFKASQFDELFDCNTAKIIYSGETYKELNDNIEVSYESGHSPKYVFRPIDYSLLLKDKDEMRIDMGDYPTWLTNKNPFDDVKYLLNRDVIINYTVPALLGFFTGKEPGVTDFDEYSYTGDDNVFSREVVLQGRDKFENPQALIPLTDEDIKMAADNVEQNVVSLARQHPETTFIYFFPPYSMAYWGGVRQEGNLERYVELVHKASLQMLECDNIHVYCFGFQEDVTSDLDNYRDVAHYSAEINDLIEDEIAAAEKGAADEWRLRITKENVEDYFEDLLEYLENYDYNSL